MLAGLEIFGLVSGHGDVCTAVSVWIWIGAMIELK